MCLKWRGRLLAIARRGVPTEADAEDVLQSFFEAYFARPPSRVSESGMERYLVKCIHNAVAQWWRREYRRRSRREALLREPPSGVPSTPMERAAEAEEVNAVRRAVASLPRRQSRAAMLHYFGEVPVAETARIMNCAEATVRSLLRHALDRLRTMFPQHQPTGHEENHESYTQAERSH